MPAPEDGLLDVFGELGDPLAAARELEIEQLAQALESEATVQYLKRLLLRMGIASPLGASEPEAAMRNFGLEMLRDIGRARITAHRQILNELFEAQFIGDENARDE